MLTLTDSLQNNTAAGIEAEYMKSAGKLLLECLHRLVACLTPYYTVVEGIEKVMEGMDVSRGIDSSGSLTRVKFQCTEQVVNVVSVIDEDDVDGRSGTVGEDIPLLVKSPDLFQGKEQVSQNNENMLTVAPQGRHIEGGADDTNALPLSNSVVFQDDSYFSMPNTAAPPPLPDLEDDEGSDSKEQSDNSACDVSSSSNGGSNVTVDSSSEKTDASKEMSGGEGTSNTETETSGSSASCSDDTSESETVASTTSASASATDSSTSASGSGDVTDGTKETSTDEDNTEADVTDIKTDTTSNEGTSSDASTTPSAESGVTATSQSTDSTSSTTTSDTTTSDTTTSGTTTSGTSGGSSESTCSGTAAVTSGEN